MQSRHHPIIIIATFTLLQIVVLCVFGYTPYPDSDGYILLAEQCVSKGDIYPIASEINHYPFLWNIGAINAVVLSLRCFHSVTPLLVVYCLMKGTTAWFLYQTTKTIINSQVALITLVLYVLYPANYGEGTSALSELPFMFFCLLAIYLAVVKDHVFTAGLMLAVANWFRPMAIVFLLAIIIYHLYKWRKSLRLLIGYVAVVAMIGSLSYQRTGLFLYQAKTGWMALIDYATDNSIESQQVRDNHQWNVCQKDSAWRSMCIDWILSNPKEYVAQMPRKLVNTYVSDNVNMCTFIPHKSERAYMYDEVSMNTLISDFPRFSAVQWLTLMNLIFYYILMIGAVASLSHFKYSYCLLPIAVISLGTLLLLFVGHGEARFHIPFMPFAIMLSSMFICQRYA